MCSKDKLLVSPHKQCKTRRFVKHAHTLVLARTAPTHTRTHIQK